MKTFFCPEDYLTYLKLLAQFQDLAGIEIWAYCLMPNHVHLVIVPKEKDSLAIYFRHVHRQYTRSINLREGWTGHLWQERFRSFVMDESHLYAAVRYTELNPVRARLCQHADAWPWSSVHAHLAGEDDEIVMVRPMLQRVSNWNTYVSEHLSESDLARIRQHSRTGRPAGGDIFLDKLHGLTDRDLRKRKPGPKPSNR